MKKIDINLADNRKVYKKKELLESQVSDNPIELFRDWFLEADQDDSVSESNAMNIATVGLDGFPKNRIVLLKQFTWEGFIFYTNYNSEKGKAIASNPKVCLSFFWQQLERQIIIKGNAEKIATNISDGYFESRPDGSKLGAIASNQSEVVQSRKELDKQLRETTSYYKGKVIERPKHWGGYIVKPISIEFWQGRPNRMHDRIRYTLQENFDWKIERLAP